MVCARHVVCMLIIIYTDYPEGASPLWTSWRSPLVSRKGVSGDRESERSGTTRVCTDEQKLHKRHSFVGEQPPFCEARSQQTQLCRCSRYRLKDKQLTRGDLSVLCQPFTTDCPTQGQIKLSKTEVSRRHSSQTPAVMRWTR